MGIRMRTSQVAVLLACMAVAVGCSEDDGFVEPPSPATVAIVGGSPQTGTTGFPLGQSLQVRVTDDDGAPMPGVPVTWAVASGGGSLLSATSTTNGDGIAINTWTLGATEGQQTVTASAAGTNTVTFTATAGSRAPLLLQRTAGNAQVGLPGDPVLTPVRVRLLDANGLPLPGAVVTWTVTSGGGSATPGTSTTNALGEASTTWRLGPPGPQTLVASSPGVGPVTFSVTSDQCGARAFASILAGGRSLETGDCLLASGPRTGSFIEYFSFPTTSQFSGTFTMNSTAVDPYLVLLRGGTGSDTVALNDDMATGNTSARLRVILAPGTYRVGATSSVPGTGAYTFQQTALPEVTNCETDGRIFVTPGVTLAHSLTATDCAAAPLSGAAGTAYHDRYRMYLRAGQTLTITYVGAAPLDPIIVLFNPAGAATVVDNGGTGGTETLTGYVAPTTGLYTLDIRTWTVNQLGPYTVTIGAATPP